MSSWRSQGQQHLWILGVQASQLKHTTLSTAHSNIQPKLGKRASQSTWHQALWPWSSKHIQTRQQPPWHQTAIRPCVSTTNHSNSMEPEVSPSRQTYWNDSTSWTRIHGVVQLESTSSSQWQIHVPHVCPQHQRINFLSSPVPQVTRSTYGLGWRSSCLLWPTRHHHHRSRSNTAQKDQDSSLGQRHHGLFSPVCQHQPSWCPCQDPSAGARTPRAAATANHTASPTAFARTTSAIRTTATRSTASAWQWWSTHTTNTQQTTKLPHSQQPASYQETQNTHWHGHQSTPHSQSRSTHGFPDIGQHHTRRQRAWHRHHRVQFRTCKPASTHYLAPIPFGPFSTAAPTSHTPKMIDTWIKKQPVPKQHQAALQEALSTLQHLLKKVPKAEQSTFADKAASLGLPVALAAKARQDELYKLLLFAVTQLEWLCRDDSVCVQFVAASIIFDRTISTFSPRWNMW